MNRPAPADTMARLDSRLREASHSGPPPSRLSNNEAWQRVRGRLEARPRRGVWYWWLLPPLAATAAAVLFIIGQREPTATQKPPSPEPPRVLARSKLPPARSHPAPPSPDTTQSLDVVRRPSRQQFTSVGAPIEPESPSPAVLVEEFETATDADPVTPDPGRFESATVIRSGDTFVKRTTIASETPTDPGEGSL